jgi:methylenetetrahydrofolate dehydrogenase (NADP+)/methenyltetrahydrofolate cyclohydrolase
MTAQILDGNALAQKLRAASRRAPKRCCRQRARPGLAVILVGEDPASQVYVRNKVNACAQAGIHSEKDVCARRRSAGRLRQGSPSSTPIPKIHGILVQLPLPKHFDEKPVLEAIAPEKDVDGFHAENVGALMQGNPRFIPCTPYGVMKLLESAGSTSRARKR